MTNRQDRRADRRSAGVEEHGILSTRVGAGHHARLIDVSASGALVDTPARLMPGSAVEMRLVTHRHRISVRGTVVRCCVARLQPVVYRGAVRFHRRLHEFGHDDVSEHQLPAREEATHDVV
jgi:hypothetical protein